MQRCLGLDSSATLARPTDRRPPTGRPEIDETHSPSIGRANSGARGGLSPPLQWAWPKPGAAVVPASQRLRSEEETGRPAACGNHHLASRVNPHSRRYRRPRFRWQTELKLPGWLPPSPTSLISWLLPTGHAEEARLPGRGGSFGGVSAKRRRVSSQRAAAIDRGGSARRRPVARTGSA